MGKSVKQVSRDTDYDSSYETVMRQIRRYERELWKNNRFCECHADNIYECNCDTEKKKRFRKRRKRKVNSQFRDELTSLIKGESPS